MFFYRMKGKGTSTIHISLILILVCFKICSFKSLFLCAIISKLTKRIYLFNIYFLSLHLFQNNVLLWNGLRSVIQRKMSLKFVLSSWIVTRSNDFLVSFILLCIVVFTLLSIPLSVGFSHFQSFFACVSRH